MNLSSRIKCVKLKNISTRVTTLDGNVWLQNRTENGYKAERTEIVPTYGFVVDTRPDLQLAEILPRFFIGSQDVAENMQILNAAGITHILNLTPNVPNFHAQNFVYERLPMLDLPNFDLSKVVPKCLTFIDHVLSVQNHKILVHCNAGVSRSSTIATAFLIYRQKLSYMDALRAVRSIRTCAKPNEGFDKYLHKFALEHTLRDMQKTS